MKSLGKTFTRLLVLSCMVQLADTGNGLQTTGPQISWRNILDHSRPEHSSECHCVLRLNGGHLQWVKRKLIQEFQDTVQKAPENRNLQDDNFEKTMCTPS
jgi:hypothetical protein